MSSGPRKPLPQYCRQMCGHRAAHRVAGTRGRHPRPSDVAEPKRCFTRNQPRTSSTHEQSPVETAHGKPPPLRYSTPLVMFAPFVLERGAYCSLHLVRSRAGRRCGSTPASLDPPPPVSAGTSPSAAPGRRGIGRPARARVPDPTRLTAVISGSPGYIGWGCFLLSLRVKVIRRTVRVHSSPLELYATRISPLSFLAASKAASGVFYIFQRAVPETSKHQT